MPVKPLELLAGDAGASALDYGEQSHVERAFYYDELGYELQIVERNVLGGITRTSVIRDCLGNPMSVTETVALSANSSTPTVKNTEYDYDDRGRLVSETVTINNSVVSSTSISYDELGRPETVSGNGLTQTQEYNLHGWLAGISATAANGNITAIKRYGSSSTTPVDDLTLSYTGNTLSSVGNMQFSYDSSGNMTSDPLRGLIFAYNILNQPSGISPSSDDAWYTYLADGTKAMVESELNDAAYAYLGSMVFSFSTGGWAFDSTPFSGGRIRKSGSAFVTDRFATDHLGSVRAIVRNGQVIERNDYYPYGGRHENSTMTKDTTNRWRFSDKEIQTIAGVNLLDFGARLYDDRLCHWNTKDPLAEKYPAVSPYAYCAGDPVNFVDVNGESVDDYIFDVDGSFVERVESSSPDRIIVNTSAGAKPIAFADPINDPQSINSRTRLVIPSYDSINSAIEQSGATNLENHGLINGCKYLWNHSDSSKNDGKLDYIVQMESILMDANYLDNLYVTRTNGDGFVAHNAYNFANFLWGASAKALGVPLVIAKIGAHLNNFIFDNHHKGTLDSKDDQLSISVGYNWQ